MRRKTWPARASERVPQRPVPMPMTMPLHLESLDAERLASLRCACISIFCIVMPMHCHLAASQCRCSSMHDDSLASASRCQVWGLHLAFASRDAFALRVRGVRRSLDHAGARHCRRLLLLRGTTYCPAVFSANFPCS